MNLYGHTLNVENYAHAKDVKNFFDGRLIGIPSSVKKPLTAEFVRRFNSTTARTPAKSASIWFRDKTERIKQLKKSPFAQGVRRVYDSLYPLYEKSELKAWAKYHAIEVTKLLADWQGDESRIRNLYGTIAHYTERHGIPAAPVYGDNHISPMLKMACPKWWHRKGIRAKRQFNETLELIAGNINKRVSPYISKRGLADMERQQAENEDYLKLMEAVSNVGEVAPLDELFKASSANPEKRRIELMVRARGMEDYADELGFTAQFITITCPSKFHQSSRKWSGATPDDARRHLASMWANARAKLCRMNVDYFGLRVAEPHHDGCPHWHMLLFVAPEHKKVLASILREYALKVDGDEAGAQKNRFESTTIDPSKGSATGYVAKYISKNINGERMTNEDDHDEEADTSASEGARRATAWARMWKIRQFQFFGAASVTLWRELRRVRESVPDELLELHSFADSGNWRAFQQAAEKHQARLYSETDGMTEYGELKKTPIGIRLADRVLVTRAVKWVIRKRDDSRATWSPVSNCSAWPNSGLFEGGEVTTKRRRNIFTTVAAVKNAIDLGVSIASAPIFAIFQRHITSGE